VTKLKILSDNFWPVNKKRLRRSSKTKKSGVLKSFIPQRKDPTWLPEESQLSNVAMASWAQEAIAKFLPILRRGKRRRRRGGSFAERERERWPRRCKQYSTLPLVAVFQVSRYGNKCVSKL
jgi:hypothetical protein